MWSRPFCMRRCWPFWQAGLSCLPCVAGELWASVERPWSGGLDSLSAPLRSFWLLSWTLPPWLARENILSYDFSLRRHLIPIEKDAYFPSARGSNGRLKRSRMHWIVLLGASRPPFLQEGCRVSRGGVLRDLAYFGPQLPLRVPQIISSLHPEPESGAVAAEAPESHRHLR